MDANKTPITVWLTPHELDLLDRAVDWLPVSHDDSRSEFILLCFRYGLLELADAGNLRLTDEDDQGFIRWYRDLVGRIEAGEYTPVEW